MKVLIACEYSGTVRDAFTKLGHYAISCDLLPSDRPKGNHYQGNVFDIIDDGFDLMIAHPPCTYLSVSGLHWNSRTPGRSEKTEEGLRFVRNLMSANIDKIIIENPISCISSRIRKPDQIIQPYNFGENASKSTCLWLKGVNKLINGVYIEPRIINGKPRWGNQTDSGQNKLAPSLERWKIRSTTYQGIADAMAEQWGNPKQIFKNQLLLTF